MANRTDEPALISDLQVIGLCRFSYPAIGGFQTEHADLAEREAFLYHTTRMDERFATFECLTLPSIRAQTDPDFLFLIVIGANMPAPMRTRLETMVRGVEQVRIIALPPERHRPAMRRAINSERDETRFSVQFRLDDDDALAVDFIAKLRARAIEAQVLLSQYEHVGIDFNHGHLLQIRLDGLSISPVCKSLLTAALGVVFAPFDSRCVMNYGHHRLAEYMPTLSLPDPDMFVRGLGRFNDSVEKPRSDDKQFSELTTADRDWLKARFGIDCNLLAARLRLAMIREN